MNSSNSSIRYTKWSIFFPIVFLHNLIQGWSYRASSTCIRVSWSIGTNLFCVTALFYRVASRTTTLCLTLPEGFHPVKLDRSRDFKHKATHTLGTSVLPVTIVNLGLQCLVCMKTPQVIVVSPMCGDAPECKPWSSPSSNPFYANIFYLGKLISEEFVMMRSRISSLSRSLTPVRDTTASSSRRSRLMERRKTIPRKIEEV